MINNKKLTQMHISSDNSKANTWKKAKETLVTITNFKIKTQERWAQELLITDSSKICINNKKIYIKSVWHGNQNQYKRTNKLSPVMKIHQSSSENNTINCQLKNIHCFFIGELKNILQARGKLDLIRNCNVTGYYLFSL